MSGSNVSSIRVSRAKMKALESYMEAVRHRDSRKSHITMILLSVLVLLIPWIPSLIQPAKHGTESYVMIGLVTLIQTIVFCHYVRRYLIECRLVDEGLKLKVVQQVLDE